MRRIERTVITTAALALLTLLLSLPRVGAQVVTPDRVVSVTYGERGGRGSDNLPESVLGPPDTVGRQTVSTIDPAEILSLGLDGEIVLAFVDNLVVDGPGVDVTVFENAFVYRLGGKDKLYAEPAEVAVSSDGVEWHTFPYDPTTLEGCAGVTPTNGDRDPSDPSVSGGDGFDLSTIGVGSFRYIRLRDVSRIILDDPSHPYYDATINGFDLDAVVAVHSMTDGLTDVPTSGDDRGRGAPPLLLSID
jgi:hypothetical protein